MFSNVKLHIGWPKTGTTSIQAALFASQETLRERGMVCTDHIHPGGEQDCNSSQTLLRRLHPEWFNRPNKHFERNLRQFEIALGNPTNAHSLLISAEGMFNWSEGTWREFLAWGRQRGAWDDATRFEVFVATRILKDWSLKLYHQRQIDSPSAGDSPQQFASHISQSLLQSTRAMRNFFEAEAFTFQGFESLRTCGYSTFWDWVGVSSPGTLPVKNSASTYEFHRLLTALGPEWNNRNQFRNACRGVTGAPLQWRRGEWEKQLPVWERFAEDFERLTGVCILCGDSEPMASQDANLWPPEFFAELASALSGKKKKWSIEAIGQAFARIDREDATFLHPDSRTRLQAGFEL